MNEESSKFSFESFEFILRHPWLFICPVVIIATLAFTYSSISKLNYKSTGVISFVIVGQNVGEAASERELIQQRNDAIQKALLGDNVRYIIDKVWPKIKEKNRPLEYEQLVERLRDQKGGIRFDYDDKNNPATVSISFNDKDPSLCYKVVEATIEVVQKENSKADMQEADTKLAFLKKQVESYNNKVKAVDEETLSLKSELREIYPYLNDQEKSVVGEVVEVGDKIDTNVSGSFYKYEEMLTNLRLKLLEAEKKKEALNKQVDIEGLPTMSAEDIDDDSLIKDYNRSITDKELVISGLIAKGATYEHPDVIKAQDELDTLKKMKEGRVKELRDRRRGLTGEPKKGEGEKSDVDTKKIDLEIATLKDQINLIKKYQEPFKEKLKPIQQKAQGVSQKVTRLMGLKNEKEINLKYYSDFRKQYEELDLKTRIEKEKIGFNVRVIDEPKVPISPVPFQKMSARLLGLMVALGAGLGLAYLADMLDDSIKTASELRHILSLPILASIDRIYTAREIAALRMRRKVIIISLFLFVIFVNLIFSKLKGVI